MQVIGLQYDVVWEDKRANFATVERMLEAAAPRPGALVVLPEMFATGFSMNTGSIADPVNGETERFLSGLARSRQVFVLAGAAVRGQDGRCRNKALAFGPGGELLAFYAKMRPFSPGEEDRHYQAGEQTVAFHTSDCAVAPFICYDLRFPELFRQAVAKDRPELFAVIANWPAKRLHHWVRLLQARAIENQAYVIGVNRVGQDPHFQYAGRSLVVDPDGEILVDVGSAEATLAAELDLQKLRQYRQGLPFLADLRPLGC